MISAAIAGFAGALLGVFQGTATVQDFEMLQGLAYLLLLVVGGVAVVSGAVLGGSLFTLFTWLPTILPSWAWLTTFGTWQQRLGPGLAGIGIGRQPSGIIPTVGEDLPRPERARARRARGVAPSARRRAPTRRRLASPPPPGVTEHRSRRPARSSTTERASGLELGLDLVGVLAQIRAGRTVTGSSKVTAGAGCSISPTSGCTSRTR